MSYIHSKSKIDLFNQIKTSHLFYLEIHSMSALKRIIGDVVVPGSSDNSGFSTSFILPWAQTPFEMITLKRPLQESAKQSMMVKSLVSCRKPAFMGLLGRYQPISCLRGICQSTNKGAHVCPVLVTRINLDYSNVY